MTIGTWTYLRDESTQTLGDLREELGEDTARPIRLTTPTQMSVTLATGADDRIVRVGTHEMPATTESIDQISDYAEVPRKFRDRFSGDLEFQEMMINRALARLPEKELEVWHSDDVVTSILGTNQVRIFEGDFVDAAITAMGAEGLVETFTSDGRLFVLEARVPSTSDRGVGGDPAVNDLTTGGLLFTQDLQHHRSPEIARVLYRLACTNGMVVTEADSRVSLKGNTVEEILVEMGELAESIFSKVEHDIEEFYTLRGQAVQNPERELMRLADEFDIPTTARNELLTRAVMAEDMFDLVNLVTNEANNPAYDDRFAMRRRLWESGGRITHSHADRCPTCRHRL